MTGTRQVLDAGVRVCIHSLEPMPDKFAPLRPEIELRHVELGCRRVEVRALQLNLGELQRRSRPRGALDERVGAAVADAARHQITKDVVARERAIPR